MHMSSAYMTHQWALFGGKWDPDSRGGIPIWDPTLTSECQNSHNDSMASAPGSARVTRSPPLDKRWSTEEAAALRAQVMVQAQEVLTLRGQLVAEAKERSPSPARREVKSRLHSEMSSAAREMPEKLRPQSAVCTPRRPSERYYSALARSGVEPMADQPGGAPTFTHRPQTSPDEGAPTQHMPRLRRPETATYSRCHAGGCGGIGELSARSGLTPRPPTAAAGGVRHRSARARDVRSPWRAASAFRDGRSSVLSGKTLAIDASLSAHQQRYSALLSAGCPPPADPQPSTQLATPLHLEQLAAISAREAAVLSLQRLAGSIMRLRGPAFVLTGYAAAVSRWRLAQQLATLRRSSLAVVEVAEKMRSQGHTAGCRLIKKGNTLRTVPEPLVHNGGNYLLKMLTDVAFIPLPLASDPFFLRWCGRDSKWWHNQDCIPTRLLGPESVSAEEFARLTLAERMLHQEAAIYDVALHDAVSPRLPEVTMELELLLYGKLGHYSRCTASIRKTVADQHERLHAATLLQRLTRQMLGRKQRIKLQTTAVKQIATATAISFQGGLRDYHFEGVRGSQEVSASRLRQSKLTEDLHRCELGRLGEESALAGEQTELESSRRSAAGAVDSAVKLDQNALVVTSVSSIQKFVRRLLAKVEARKRKTSLISEREGRYRDYKRRSSMTFPAAKTIAAAFRRTRNFTVVAADLLQALDDSALNGVSSLAQFPLGLSVREACVAAQRLLEPALKEEQDSIAEIEKDELADSRIAVRDATVKVRHVHGMLQMLCGFREQREQTAERAAAMLVQLRPLEEAEQSEAHEWPLPDEDDFSPVGSAATSVQKHEGALAALTMLKQNVPLGQTDAIAAMFFERQRSALLRVKAARAKHQMADLAREKLTNLDGKLEMGTELTILLSSAPEASHNQLLRQVRHRIEGRVEQAEKALDKAKTAQATYEKALVRMHRAGGRLPVLRVAAENAACEMRGAVRVERRQQLGIVSSGRTAYERHKRVSRHLREFMVACYHGAELLKAEEKEQEAIAAGNANSVSLLVSGVSAGAPLRPGRLTMAVQEQIIADLCVWLGLRDPQQLRIRTAVPARVPEDAAAAAAGALPTAAVRLTVDVLALGDQPRPSNVIDLFTAKADAARFPLDDVLASAAATLGTDAISLCEVKAFLPTQQGTRALSNELVSAIESVRRSNEELQQLCHRKGAHKASRTEAHRRHSATQLPPEVLFCMAHGWDGPDAVAGGGPPQVSPQVLQERMREWGRIPQQLQLDLVSQSDLKAKRAAIKADRSEQRGLARLLRGLVKESEWQKHKGLHRCDNGIDLGWNFAHHLVDELNTVLTDDDIDLAHPASATKGSDDASASKGTSAPTYIRKGSTFYTAALEHDAEQYPAWWTRGKICLYCVNQGAHAPSPKLHHRYIDCELRKAAGEKEYSKGAAERAVAVLRQRRDELAAEAERLRPMASRVRDARLRMAVLEGQIQLMNSIQTSKYSTDRRATPPAELQVFHGPLYWTHIQAALRGRSDHMASLVSEVTRVRSCSPSTSVYWERLKGMLALQRMPPPPAKPIGPEDVRNVAVDLHILTGQNHLLWLGARP